MSGAGNLDPRVPIGALFVTLGSVLAGYGMLTASDVTMYARSDGVNLNLVWGLVLFVFGALMLWLARRHSTPSV